MSIFIKKLFQFLFSAIFIFIFFSVFNQIEEKLVLIKSFKSVFALIVFLLVSYVIFNKNFFEKYYKRYLLIGIIIIAFLVRLRTILTVESTLISDFALLYNTANKFLNGEENVFNIPYYDTAVYNIPFTLYLSFIIKYLGGLFTIKFLNILWSIGIVILIYKITEKIFDYKTAVIALLIGSLFPPFVIYTTVLTNQTISIFFLILGVYLFLNKQFIYSGLFIGFGHIFRPIGTVFLIAILLTLIFTFLIDFKFSSIKFYLTKLVKDFFKIVLPYQLVIFTISCCFFLFNITDKTLYYNPAPSYKLLVGLNPERTGQWNKADQNLLRSDNFEALAKNEINKRLSNKINLINLFEEKFKLMWGKLDAVFFWSNYNSPSKKQITNYFWLIIVFSCLCYVILRKAKKMQNEEIFLLVILLGFIIAYLLIEIQPRYRYEIYPIFIIFAAKGCSLLYINLKQHNYFIEKNQNSNSKSI